MLKIISSYFRLLALYIYPITMAFDPKKATEKVNEVLNSAINLATEEQHATLTPLHLAVVLFEVRRAGRGRGNSEGLADRPALSR